MVDVSRKVRVAKCLVQDGLTLFNIRKIEYKKSQLLRRMSSHMWAISGNGHSRLKSAQNFRARLSFSLPVAAWENATSLSFFYKWTSELPNLENIRVSRGERIPTFTHTYFTAIATSSGSIAVSTFLVIITSLSRRYMSFSRDWWALSSIFKIS